LIFFKPRRTICIYFIIILLFAPSFLEAGDLSFRVEQSKIRLIIPPGGSQAGMFKVYSQSDDKIKLKAYFEDWAYNEEKDGSKDFFPAKSTSLSCADWVTFNPAEFVLPPHGAQTVNYVVHMPPDAQGGHYAVMFLETSLLRDVGYPMDTQTKELTVGTSLNIRLGVLFYLEAEGTVRRQARLSNLSVAKASDGKNLLFSCDFKNVGNADITTKPTFDIIDQGGMVYARGEFNEIYTFPQDEAKLTATWRGPLPKGKYDLILTLDLGQVLKEAGLGRGPVMTKEAEIEIGANNEAVKVGELR